MIRYYGNILSRQAIDEAAFPVIPSAINANMWFRLSSFSHLLMKFGAKLTILRQEEYR
jgi:hypothetical protein